MCSFRRIKRFVPFVVLELMVFMFGSFALGDECEVASQRRCRQTLVAELEKLSRGGPSEHQLEIRCSKLGDNLNCLVLQVTRCPTPNRSGDLIARVWKYMQDNCDAFGGWWSYDCFHLEDMKKCEKIFALRDSKTSQASCREYDRFRHCISDVVQKQCSREDYHSMGNYLLDSSGDMVWDCPSSPLPHLKSPQVQEGYVGVNRKQDYSSAHSSDEERYSAHSLPKAHPSGKEHYSSHSLPKAHSSDNEHYSHSLPIAPSVGIKRRSGGRIDVEESHLNRVYSSALTGEGPYLTGCNARATEEMKGCLDRHQFERDQALGARGEEDRLRKECCATWNYRRCLQHAVRRHCYDTREVDVQSAVDVIPHDKGFLCRNHWIYTCSGAQRALLSNGMAAFLVLAATALMSYVPLSVQ